MKGWNYNNTSKFQPFIISIYTISFVNTAFNKSS